jgi:Protein of unknown function (DUF2806)
MSQVPDDPSAGDPFGLRHLAKLSDATASVCHNIIDRVSSAIGTPYDDLMIVVRARRQAEAKTLLAKADADAEAYRRATFARADREIAAATALHHDQIEARAKQLLITSATRHQGNIEAITVAAIEHVIEQTTGGETLATATVEPTSDWMAEFIDLCKNASDARMQDLWARVLAGETQRPGSFSIRALFTLKTLLPSEAKQFRKACNFVLNGDWIHRSGEDEAAPAGLPFGDFLDLASAGLIAPDASTAWATRVQGEGIVITYEPYLLLFEKGSSPTPEQMTIPAWLLTAVGKELVQLITVEHDWNYVRSFVAAEETDGWNLKCILTPQGFPPPPDDLPTQFTAGKRAAPGGIA